VRDFHSLVFCQTDDSQTLAELLNRLRTDEVVRANVGAAAAKAALQWTWDRNAADIWEVVKDVARKKTLPSVRKA